jgi:electron transfer flavoprotein alpha subunit
MKKQCNDKYNGILVYCELNMGELASVTIELLGEGRRLANQLGASLSAIIIGDDVGKNAKQCIAYGADQVVLIEAQGFTEFNVENHTQLLVAYITQYKPEIVLFGATAFGSSLAPKVATRIGTGLTAECTNLEIDPESHLLLQTRPTLDGRLMATIICQHSRPQMCTVKPKIMKPVQPDQERIGTVIKPLFTIDTDSVSKIVECVASKSSDINLASANIVVGIGRGVNNHRILKLVKQFADLIGAVTGGTRGSVDSGLVSAVEQIGQTGLAISPHIYIACGISGATQHMVGIMSADLIIAINKDPNAPIFKMADIGVVGDLEKIMPEFIERFQR